eukprot:7961286-Pyramimonas_sp.AAC.1
MQVWGVSGRLRSVLGGILGPPGAPWGLLEGLLVESSTCRCVLPLLGPSWAALGGSLGLSWAVLRASGAVLGRSWGPLGPSWNVGSLRRWKRYTCQAPHQSIIWAAW